MSEFKMTINGEDYIAHYGVRGMKRGLRRWTNSDGSLNEAGKLRYKKGKVKGTNVETRTIIKSDGSQVIRYLDKDGKEIGRVSNSYPYERKEWEAREELNDLMKNRQYNSYYNTVRSRRAKEKPSKKRSTVSETVKRAYKSAVKTAGKAYDKGKSFVTSLFNRKN